MQSLIPLMETMNSAFFNPGRIASRGTLRLLTLFEANGICGESAGFLIQSRLATPLFNELRTKTRTH